MTNYTVRVELHDADDGDYEELHKKMRAQGFSRYLNINGVHWKLPSAEYSIVGELTPEQVLIKAQTAANQVQPQPEPSILVTRSPTPRVFSGLKKLN